MGNPTRIKAAVPGEPPRCALTKSRPRGAKARAAGREHVNQTHHPPPVPERLRAIEEYEQQVADASVTIGEIYALWQGTAEILARIDLRALTRKLRPEVLPVVGAVVSCARDIRASVDNGVAPRDLLDALRAACRRSRSAVRVGPRDAAEAHVDPHQSLWQQHG